MTDLVETLKSIYEVEQKMSENELRLGWSWMDVKLYPAQIHKLLIEGWVNCTFKSNSGANYKLTEEAISLVLAPPEEVKEEFKLPDTLFDEIIGYDDVKQLIRESLLLEKPIHILLYGPPSIAKTMFLWSVEQAYKGRAMWVVGSALSRAGLWDLIADRKPDVLLVDELEKMSVTDHAGFLTLMEGGRLVRTKVGRHLDETINVRVIAVANTITNISAELLSRFAKRQLAPYSRDEYIRVVSTLLVQREGLSEAGAQQVAKYLVDKTVDVRDAIRVARLSKRVGIERAIELLLAT